MPMPHPAPVTSATLPSSRRVTFLPAAHRGGGHGELVGVDGNLHDRGLAGGEGSADDVAHLVGMVDVVAVGAEEAGQLVVARVADVAADVALAEEVLLVGLLRAP